MPAVQLAILNVLLATKQVFAPHVLQAMLVRTQAKAVLATLVTGEKLFLPHPVLVSCAVAIA